MIKSTHLSSVLNGVHFGKERNVVTLVNYSSTQENINALMWLNDKNIASFSNLCKGVLIVSELFDKTLVTSKGITLIIVSNPRRAFQTSIDILYPDTVKFEIASSAVISSSARIGENCNIGHHVVVEENVEIGNNCIILSNTVILKNTKIGNNCRIGANCTIGGVGFGYEKDESGNYSLIRHVGNVVIFNGVDIGNNTCIDRAVLGSTIISENVKVDNLVHIAHGVIIGKNSLIIANAMIAGSTKIGENVWVAPSASILNKKIIGDNAVVGIGAVVLRNVDESTVVVGNPAKKIGS